MSAKDNDFEKSLEQIARCHGESIVSLLIDIQESQIKQQKYRPFVENLECLSLCRYQPTLLSRRRVNAFENPSYVALSYTWDASNEIEDPSKGRYKVQSRRSRSRFDPSEVRDCVFDRILKYMRRFRLELLWIDQHSIVQTSCKEIRCDHQECKQKLEGLSAMDLVYKHSEHPVALLATRIESRSELKLLVRILRGDLVSSSRQKLRFQLSGKTNQQEATEALDLLKKVTGDRWWKRGWIYQESYRAGVAMSLLIPHSPGLESLKRSFGTTLFNDIIGELCINIINFSYQATRLCLAFDSEESPPLQAREAIRQITNTAGRYTLLVEKHESMSPTIISDISKRSLVEEWDRIEVAANCCQYSWRLDITKLQEKEHSISLSMLALCLVNGEIFCNRRVTGLPSQMTVLEFLTSHSFKGFFAPLNRRSLSFNKGCRFPYVKLTRGGVSTRGHLWKLGRKIWSREIVQQPSWVNDPTGKLGLHSKRLTQLANRLQVLRYFTLRNRLWRFLKHDARCGSNDRSADTFAGSYMRTMASELAGAIDRGMVLRLACIWDPSKPRSSYRSPHRAIFICDKDPEDNGVDLQHSVQGNGPSFVFTASSPKGEGSPEYDINDIDHHVSLEVQHVGSVKEPKGTVPRLRIRRWVLGLCFFEGIETKKVLFPWPPGLEAIIS